MTSRARTSRRGVSPRVARLLRARVSGGSLLCFDLDGPLLDVSERYWRVHLSAAGLDVAASHGRARYLSLKRRGATDEEICRRLRIQVAASEYSARRRALLEQAEYLAFDRVWKWTGRVLTILHQAYRIAIVTKRQNAQTYRGQLLATGLRRLVDAEACEADVEGHAGDKGALIRRAERSCSEKAVALVGDTELDVQTARSMGLIAIAVSCGLQDRRRLSRARPDVLLDDVNPLPQLLQPRSVRTDRE